MYPAGVLTTGEALVLYINSIRMSVCLSVCLFVCKSGFAERTKNCTDLRFSPKVAEAIGECVKTLTFQIAIMVWR